MSVLEKINYYFYSLRFSFFDLMYISLIGSYAADAGFWWILLLIPASFASVMLTNRFGQEREHN